MKLLCSLLLGSTVVLAQDVRDYDARDYEKFMGRWNRQLAPELLRFAALADGAKILDYGCTTGALSLRAAVRFPLAAVVGVDTSTAYVAWAQTQSPRAGVRFQTADLTKLPFTIGEFDATLTLNLPPDAKRALVEMLRVTKPEGVVAAAAWDYGPGMQPLHEFWSAAKTVDENLAPADGPDTPYSKKGQLEELWKSVNMRDVEERLLEVEFTYASFDEYWAPFLAGQGTAGAWLMSQSEPKRAAVREALRKALLGSRAGGPVTLRGRAWAVRGIPRATP